MLAVLLIPSPRHEHRTVDRRGMNYILADVLDTLLRMHLVWSREVARKQLIDSLKADLEYFERVRMPSEFERYRPEGVGVPLV